MTSPEPTPESLDETSSADRTLRTPGSMQGIFHVPDNFNDPLPDWLLDAFEGVESPSEE